MNEFVSVARASLEAVERNEPVALASLVRIRGSSPRHIGSRMLIWPNGQIVGTIGGGTLEWRVMEHARVALAERRQHFANYVFDSRGGPDSVGLCGGSVDVHIDIAVKEFAAVAQAALAALARGETVVLASRITAHGASPDITGTRLLIWPGGRTLGSLGDEALQARVTQDAQSALLENKTRLETYAVESAQGPEDVVVHLEVLRPDPTLLIIGAGHVAQPLAAVGSLMGMRVCVMDDRAEWANRERFPTAAKIAVVGYEPIPE